MKLKKLLIGLVLVLNASLAAPVLLPATASAATAEHCNKSSSSLLGFPTWYKNLSPAFDGTSCNVDFQIDRPGDIAKVVLAVFEIILRLAGLVAVGFVIYGGFQYILSQGEPDRLKGARGTIINALIGLVIAISATVIVNLISGVLI